MSSKIQDIAPILADQFIDIEADQQGLKLNKILIDDNAIRLGLYYKYLGLLHDSWFIQSNIFDDKYTIILNDFTTHVFADVIVDRKGLNINHDKLIFPIQVDFQITDLTFNIVDEDGIIQRIQSPPKLDKYLYEQIISIDDQTINIGLVTWRDGTIDTPGQRILVLISARSITLTELQDMAWKQIFGNKYDNYYKYFRDQLDNGRYLSDQTKCIELVDEFDALKR